ncbi:MAG: DUF6603 domain-containing protein [Haloarculaceae archaeon]
MPVYSTLGSLRTTLGTTDWLADFVSEEDLPAFLDDVYVLNYELEDASEGAIARTTIAIEGETAIGIPGLDGVKLVGGSDIDGYTTVTGQVRIAEDWRISLLDVDLSLRFDSETLSPATLDGSDPDAEYVEVSTTGSIHVDSMLDIEIEGFDSFDLSPAEIGDSGVIIAAEDVMLDLSRTSSPSVITDAGFDRSFVGVYVGDADVVFPDSFPVPDDLKLEDCAIGSGGVSGSVSMTNDDLGFDDDEGEFTGDGATEIGGFAFGLREVTVEFKQNTLIASTIEGELYIPYFDKRVSAEVGFDLDGSLSVRVTGPTQLDDTDDAVDPDTGLLTLDADAFKLEVESIELTVDDPSTLAMAGTVTPTVEDLDLPGLDVEELAVDSNGDVHFQGGWVDLPNQYSADFYGVTLDLTKLGFGKTDAGKRWVGLNGGISIVEGVPAGASVEGLRIFWDDDGFDHIELNGIGVEFTVPGTLEFKGEVAFDGEEFAGAIELELVALNLTIDAQLVVGEHEEGFTYFGIYLDADLPAGIPLFSTGTGFYGFAGLFAHQMEPAKGDEEKWYDLSKEDSWFHADPEVGVTHLDKWEGRAGGLGLGAGVTVATLPDNGFSVAADLLLVIAFPGPIIMLQGQGDILSEGTNTSDEATFRSIAVLDNREGSFTFGMDAQYTKGGEDGALIDISASVEAFFSFHDPTAWYLNIGKREPAEDRIRAKALYLFTADAYFMMDPDRLAFGAKVGYDANWSFGPLGVTFEAWIAGNAMVNWEPMHFYGELLAHGKVALKAFGFSMGLTVDARVAADVYDPFHLVGEFSVDLQLPWPLPDPSANVTLEWGPQKAVPPVPRPLDGVAIGHQKSTARWPLARESTAVPGTDGAQTYPPLITPDYGDENLLHPGGLGEGRPDAAESPPAHLPVVPPDGRPRLTFAKPVHDVGNVGVNHQPVKPEREVIGDPAKNEGPIEVKYSLTDVRLKRREGSTWAPVEDVYGSWAPLPKSQAGTGGATTGGGTPAMSNTKLELYSKNPFDYGRHTHGAWEEGTQRLLEDYPCTVNLTCFDFEGLTQEDFVEKPVEVALRSVGDTAIVGYRLEQESNGDWPTFSIQAGEGQPTPRIETVLTPDGARKALVYPRRIVEHGTQYDRDPELLESRVTITLGEPHPSVRLTLGGKKHETVGTVAAHGDDDVIDTQPLSFDVQSEGETFTFTAEDGDIEKLVIEAKGPIAIAEVCQSDADIDRIGPQETSGIDHTRAELARWADEADVLEPDAVYRLEVDTVVEARGRSGGALEGFTEQWFDDSDPLTEFVYFRTGGPPGLGPGSTLPTTVNDPETFSTGLEDLTRYVQGTVPETVPAAGEQPLEPRPVYRAYDVGVDFAEDYVETLYRMARRDLALYLFDTNDRPVRDAAGRLIATENQWGSTDAVLLDDHDRSWLRRVKGSGCMDVDERTLPLDDALAADDRVVLGPETSYEARLSPMLLQDTFDDGRGHWHKVGHHQPDLVQWQTPGHDRLAGDNAEPDGTTVTLEVTPGPDDPSLADLEANADSIHFPGDRNRESGTYRITGIDAGADEVTLDGEPDLADARQWSIAPRHALQQRAVVAGSAAEGPETTLELSAHPRLADATATPTEWTDYRVQTTIRAGQVAAGAVGVAFRRDDAGDGYRFELDAAENAWKLVRVVDGDAETLDSHQRLTAGLAGAPDLFDDDQLLGSLGGDFGGITPWNALEAGRDYRITIEAIGSDIRIAVDGDPVIAVEDETIQTGTVGVYCRAVAEATVSGIRVDDFRRGEDGAPVPYRFSFTTSKYANFFHHAHSFQDETWGATADLATTGAAPTGALDDATGVDLDYADVGTRTPPPPSEVRSFDAALSTLAGDDPLAQLLSQRPDRVSVTRFDGSDSPLAYLLQSPEPIDWARTEMEPEYANADLPAPAVPDVVKLTDATLGSEESATVLFREATDPSGYAVDYRRSTEPGFDATLTDERFRESFAGSFDARYDVTHRLSLDDRVITPPPIELPDGGPDGGVDDGLDIERQFLESLSAGGELPGSEASRTTAALMTTSTGSRWRFDDGAIVGDGFGIVDVVAAGVTATDGIWTATVAAADPGEVGLLFRYAGEDDHYRFSVSADDGLRLIRRAGGTTEVLWETERAAVPDREYRFCVVAVAGKLRGTVDGIPAFVVDDPGGAGRVGVHAARAGEVMVTELSVHEESYQSVLFADDFSSDLDAWTFEDIPPYTTQESDWHIDGGQLRQTSNIYGHVGNEYHEPGTHGVTGDPEWRDYRATVTLGSGDNDALGLLIRYQDRDNYYRLSMDHERAYRRLVKRVDGTTYLLWEDDEQYEANREHVLTVECVGATITGYLDGRELFSVEDDDLDAGQVGLYCRANDAAFFDDVQVTAPADSWQPYYGFGDEDRLPAGTRVRINRAAPGPGEAGLVQRDLAPDGDGPGPLPPSGVDLRVRPPGIPLYVETTGHVRRFLADDEYAGFDSRMLRNADGTGVIIVPNESVAAGQLRLSMTYHRDANDGTLREAGSGEPEAVTLDVPWWTRSATTEGD